MAFKTTQGSLASGVQYVANAGRTVYSKTSAAETITADQFVDGYVSQDAAQAAHNLTTPTATAALAAIKDPVVGMTFSFVVANPTGGNTITVVGGTGVTVRGTATIAASASRAFIGVVRNVGTPAIDLVSSA